MERQRGFVVFNKLDFQDAVGRWNDGIPLLDLRPTNGKALRSVTRNVTSRPR